MTRFGTLSLLLPVKVWLSLTMALMVLAWSGRLRADLVEQGPKDLSLIHI